MTIIGFSIIFVSTTAVALLLKQTTGSYLKPFMFGMRSGVVEPLVAITGFGFVSALRNMVIYIWLF